MIHHLTPPVKEWWCPACKRELRDRDPRTRVPMHPCPALKGVTVPMTLDRRAAVVAVERGDWVRGDTVHLDDDGKAVMAIETHHDDRPPDVTILAPCINVRASAH